MTSLPNLPIILASASPRRREFFRALGIAHETAPANVVEDAIPYRTPRELAIKAAFAKACAVEPRYPRGLLVAADTIVVLDGTVYGKPGSPDEARRMLGELSGHTHSVITGLAVREIGKSALLDAEETRVRIRSLQAAEIDEYVATGEPLDKAGAYAVQGIGRRIVEGIDGDYFNVVGLPIRRLLEMLSRFTDTSEYERNLAALANPFGPDAGGGLKGALTADP
jgi:septum formation protein